MKLGIFSKTTREIVHFFSHELGSPLVVMTVMRDIIRVLLLVILTVYCILSA